MPYPSYQIYIDEISKSPKQDWIDDFSKLIDFQFYNSSDWFTIQEELLLGSGTYSNVDVRINYVFNPTTGKNMGDDWKLLMFSDISKNINFGQMFYFDDNYWVAVNVERVKNLSATCIVRRCNNTLRWQGDSGELYTFPCVLDYEIIENRNYSSAMSAMVNPSGILRVISQLNSKTNKIRPNLRFLFGNSGNWTGYKVQGGGVNNFNNAKTLVNSDSGMLTLTLSVDFVNEQTDDLVNGFADVYEHVYTISISGVTSGQEGSTSQLFATVYLNGVVVDRDVEWLSDDEDVAIISSSGVLTFVSEGTASISAQLVDNDAVTDTVMVETLLVPANQYTIRVSPDDNAILEGESTLYSVYLYLDDVLQPDTFTFSISPSDVPSDNYKFTVIDGNRFSVENFEMFLTDTLDILCSSGLNSKLVEIHLRGGW